jgi:hypothetical protein
VTRPSPGLNRTLATAVFLFPVAAKFVDRSGIVTYS